MAMNDAMKVSPAELKQRMIAALLREKEGYERRLVRFAAEPDEELRAEKCADAQRRLDEVSAQLKVFGHEGAAPARRAERRPAAAAVTR